MKSLLSAAIIGSLLLLNQNSDARSYADNFQRMPLRNWEYVNPRLSLHHERHFDLFFFVNTGEKPTSNQAPVPAQHLLIVKRKSGAKPYSELFIRRKDSSLTLARDANGRVTGLTINAEVVAPEDRSKFYPESDLFPVSTGKWNSGNLIHTYSGIFGFNPNYNLPGTNVYSSHGTDTFTQYGMARSSFIDVTYTNGTQAALAFHATPLSQYPLLGKARASEGCVRQTMNNARQIQDLLMQHIGTAPELLSQMDYQAGMGREYGDTDDIQFGKFWTDSSGNGRLRSGVQRGLAIFFNDYFN